MDLQDVGVEGRLDAVLPDVRAGQRPGGGERGVRRAGRLRGERGEDGQGRRGQVREPVRERRLQAVVQRPGVPGKLGERQRMTGGLGQDALPPGRCQAGSAVVQHLAGRPLADLEQVQLVQADAGQHPAVPGPGGDHQRDRVQGQPAGHEDEHAHGLRVEAVRVVDQQRQRGAGGHGVQQVQHGQAHGEPARALVRRPERDPQDPRPGRGVEQRGQELVQGGEGESRLGLGPGGGQHGHPRGGRARPGRA